MLETQTATQLDHDEIILATARDVIAIESDVIAKLQHCLNDDFIAACKLLHACTGRIAVTGVGKSGHISRKIAATFSSTGAPAFFIHPSEAKHGDAGMITKGDVVVALSYSGESDEVLAILPYLKRLALPLIAITGNPESTLAKAATVHLNAHVEKEACPLGLAPTSSTTAALVLGDALAMALLNLHGFTKHDFALSHPGGTLGRRLLLRVQDLMHSGNALPRVTHSTSFKDALVEMSQKKLGVTTVVDDEGCLIGIFTDGDIRRSFDKKVDVHHTTVKEVMSQKPKTIPADLLAVEALNMMQTHHITSLIITDPTNHPLGLIHIHDILNAGVV